MLILNKNPAAVTTANTQDPEIISPISNPHPISGVIQQVSNEPLPTAAGGEMAPTVTAVPSDLQTSTSTAPILPSQFQDSLPMQSPTSEQSILDVNLESFSEDFLQPSTPIQPGVADIWSDLPILQPDAEMLEEIGLPNTDIVSFTDSLLSTASNLCDNCKTQIQQPASLSGVHLPEDTNNTAGNGFTTPTVTDKIEEELNRQKSTIYIDMGHLSSQSAFIDPMHPRANITLAKLNQEPVVSLDPHRSAIAQYHTPTPSLDDVDGTPHSDSFTRAIAPVYCDWNCWNDPEYASRMLQQDLEDFDEILHEVTSTHEQEQREEEERKRKNIQQS